MSFFVSWLYIGSNWKKKEIFRGIKRRVSVPLGLAIGGTEPILRSYQNEMLCVKFPIF